MASRLLGPVLLLLVWVGLASARECDFSSREKIETALVAEEIFLAAGRGTVAIREGQCSRAEDCDRYLIISQCGSITYAHPGVDATNPLSLVFLNSVEDCEQAACADTFLSAAMIFGPDERYRPEIEFIRNDSLRWASTAGVDTRGGYNRAVSQPRSITDLLALIVADNSRFRDLVDRGVAWHSSFRIDRPWSDGTVSTWDMRDRVLWAADVERCGAQCAMKLFLTKFEEAQGKPSSLLRISGRMGSREGMLLRTHAEVDGSPYDRMIEFHFVNR